MEAKKFATYDDLLKVPPELIAEIIAGQLITSPRPGPRHVRASSKLGIKIGGPFDEGNDGPGGWWILDEPEIHLDGNVLVPDLAGWKKEITPKLPTENHYFDIAPQWVCEILSKSTAGIDRVKKMPIYAKAKVENVWLIDPEIKTLEVFSRHEQGWFLRHTFSEDDIVRATPFEAVEMALGALWLPD